MTDRAVLRERVAKDRYEEKRARLLEAFRDTAGWPEWENLKQTLKDIEIETYAPVIDLVLEQAALVAEAYPASTHGALATAPYAAAEQAADEIAAAIRALKGGT